MLSSLAKIPSSESKSETTHSIASNMISSLKSMKNKSRNSKTNMNWNLMLKNKKSSQLPSGKKKNSGDKKSSPLRKGSGLRQNVKQKSTSKIWLPSETNWRFMNVVIKSLNFVDTSWKDSRRKNKLFLSKSKILRLIATDKNNSSWKVLRLISLKISEKNYPAKNNS